MKSDNLRSRVVALFLAASLIVCGCNKPREPATPGDLVSANNPGGAAADKHAGANSANSTTGDSGNAAGTSPASDKRDAMQILREMEATYKQATTYADAGQVLLRFTRDGQPLEEAFNFAVSFARPNKLRLIAYDAMVVSDGQKLHASVGSVKNVVLQVKAPETLTVETVIADPNVAAALVQGPGGFPVPLPFLLAENTLAKLLDGILQPPKLLQPEPLDGARCNRVEIDNPDGQLTLWIDQQSNLIRRIDLPTQAFKKVLDTQGAVSDVVLTIVLHEARINKPIDDLAFKFEVPATARVAESLVEEVPPVKILERSEPGTLKLTKLWTAEGMQEPGNLLLVPGDAGQPRIFAIDGWRTVVELDAAGKLVAKHELPLPETAIISYLRTATDVAGKRYFVAVGSAQTQLHVFDENWQPLLSFPKPEDGGDLSIGDVQLLDLAGNGTPSLYVGYWGDVGVHGVGLDGQRQWRDRSLQFVPRLAVSDAAADGRRRLLATHSRGTIVPFNFEGQPEKDIVIPNRHVHTLHAADLAGRGQQSYLGLAGSPMDDNTALGVSLDGKELWNYSLPRGVHLRPIEMIAAGDVNGDGVQEWILAGADGSVHFVDAEGKPLDKFNSGVRLTGVAATTIDGKPALLLSSVPPQAAAKGDEAGTAPQAAKGMLEAWTVEDKE